MQDGVHPACLTFFVACHLRRKTGWAGAFELLERAGHTALRPA